MGWTAVAAVLLGGLAGPAHAGDAAAELRDADGQEMGEVELKESPHGILVHADLEGMPEGTHAFHIHETGQCEPPFKSAGGHFNPEGKAHGFMSEEGYHAGDMPNIHVPGSGDLELEYFAPGVKLDELLDDDGGAILVHEGADDYKTDPAGDAGSRIACGVIED
ncbi:MAG: superoxide dismutase family protein [Thiohalorhabdus sp.]